MSGSASVGRHPIARNTRVVSGTRLGMSSNPAVSAIIGTNMMRDAGWLSGRWPNKTLLERIVFARPGGRVMTGAAAFFTDNEGGPLPWIWSSKPIGQLEVDRMDRA